MASIKHTRGCRASLVTQQLSTLESSSLLSVTTVRDSIHAFWIRRLYFEHKKRPTSLRLHTFLLEMWRWWWRENNKNVVVVVVMAEGNNKNVMALFLWWNYIPPPPHFYCFPSTTTATFLFYNKNVVTVVYSLIIKIRPSHFSKTIAKYLSKAKAVRVMIEQAIDDPCERRSSLQEICPKRPSFTHEWMPRNILIVVGIILQMAIKRSPTYQEKWQNTC